MDVTHAVKGIPSASPCDGYTVHVKRLGVAKVEFACTEGGLRPTERGSNAFFL